jgi:hypothetical protein
MNKYPGSLPANNPKLHDAFAVDLEFPIDPDFLSVPPRLDPQVMLRRIAETMPWRSTRPGEVERRLAGKIDVEFIL